MAGSPYAEKEEKNHKGSLPEITKNRSLERNNDQGSG